MLNKIKNEVIAKEPNLLFLTLTGSRAYGLNDENSDYDVRGVFINTESELFGLNKRNTQKYEVDDEDDTILISLKRFAEKASQASPNILELLFIDPKHHIFVNPVFQIFLDNRNIFLSKRTKRSYTGYAYGQMIKCKNHSKHGTLREKYKVGTLDDSYDGKYAQHTCRLLLNGKEILDEGTLTPCFTGHTAKFLKDIKAGKVFATATRLFEYVKDDIDTNLPKLYEETTLQEYANFELINQLLIEAHKNYIYK